jgi:beta-glucosidase/6-phospho-beta-glucosidase/beta-galactosidase
VLDAQRWDFDRSMYIQNFLMETLHAIHLDGVNVIGALVWSILDSNEFDTHASQYGSK